MGTRRKNPPQSGVAWRIWDHNNDMWTGVICDTQEHAQNAALYYGCKAVRVEFRVSPRSKLRV